MADVPDIFPQDELDDVFDSFDPDDDIGLVDTASEVPIPYGFTWQYDFNKEDLDFTAGNPPIVRELGVVNEWILHTLNTERFETPIFGEDIGTSIFSLIGSVLDPYVMSRVRQEVVNAIDIHDRVEEVTFISAFALKGNIYAYLSYQTDDTIDGQALVQLR
jgi:hypothetical protein